VVAMGERLIREGDLLPGDRPAGEISLQAVASSGTQPVGKLVEKIPRLVSATDTQPEEKWGKSREEIKLPLRSHRSAGQVRIAGAGE
jgi:hypothetical protein